MMLAIVFQLFLTDLVLILFGALISHIFWDYSVTLMPTWWKMIFGISVMLMFPILFVLLMTLIWGIA